ncbi:fructose-6-phosphate aldolase [Blattabacterium cuenoti]|uniref:fructose-6-phosphate aldolase n=1 Tax=Blattabacterium cuenoti TaxID=1653831 RepID=UPI00163CA5CA|nr:fructose-6-phosphate aldolase [Blattabacterium cuenoti]
MKFFIDTANLKEINEAKSIGILDGVTTNPSLIAKENIYNKKDILQHYLSICNIVKDRGRVSAEVINTSYDKIIKEGMYLASIHPRIVVKIPMILDGIKSIKYFSEKNIKTNCTLIFSVSQAILAAKAGATYVSPFIGRIDDIHYSGLNLIKEIQYAFDKYKFNTKIIAASIRNTIHILECIKIGIFAVTSPLNILHSLYKHPLTDIGLNKFIKDYKSKIS